MVSQRQGKWLLRQSMATSPFSGLQSQQWLLSLTLPQPAGHGVRAAVRTSPTVQQNTPQGKGCCQEHACTARVRAAVRTGPTLKQEHPDMLIPNWLVAVKDKTSIVAWPLGQHIVCYSLSHEAAMPSAVHPSQDDTQLLLLSWQLRLHCSRPPASLPALPSLIISTGLTFPSANTRLAAQSYQI